VCVFNCLLLSLVCANFIIFQVPQAKEEAEEKEVRIPMEMGEVSNAHANISDPQLNRSYRITDNIAHYTALQKSQDGT
jgi:hypothetical protein